MMIDLILYYKKKVIVGVKNVKHHSITKKSSTCNNVTKSTRLKTFVKANTNDIISMERILNKDRDNPSDTRIQNIIPL